MVSDFTLNKIYLIFHCRIVKSKSHSELPSASHTKSPDDTVDDNAVDGTTDALDLRDKTISLELVTRRKNPGSKEINRYSYTEVIPLTIHI